MVSRYAAKIASSCMLGRAPPCPGGGSKSEMGRRPTHPRPWAATSPLAGALQDLMLDGRMSLKRTRSSKSVTVVLLVVLLAGIWLAAIVARAAGVPRVGEVKVPG